MVWPIFVFVIKSINTKQVRISEEISERQAFALGVINVLIQRNPDLPPTIAEIARYLDMSKQAVSRLLMLLERKGYVLRGNTRRSLRLTGKEVPYATQKGKVA